MQLKSVLWMAVLSVPSALLSAQDQGDPPSRVARLNYVYGTVSFRPSSVTEWAPATVNYPLTSGDHLWTDTGGNAEMHVGSSAVRLSSQAAFGILNLDEHSVQTSLSQGSMHVRLGALTAQDTFEVDTPNGAVSLTGPGEYRIDVNSDKNFTAVTVRAGKADVTGNGEAFPVLSGQQSRFMGTDKLITKTAGAPGRDGWDQWCESRDHRSDESIGFSQRHVPAEMTGVEDLAVYGTWRDDPSYGSVWKPARMEANWEPYRFGHWAYVRPWGWTWIDDAPWGFAPFHYGRWVILGGEWVWIPGQNLGGRPIYAPALVAFIGGDGLRAGLQAWIALGPREVYRPWYGHSGTYIERVNSGHFRRGEDLNVTNVTYVNRTHTIAAQQEVFAGARHVGRNGVSVSPNAIGHIRPAAAEVRPGREAMLGQSLQPGARVAAPPSHIDNRQVFARNSSMVHTGNSVRVASPPVRVGSGAQFSNSGSQMNAGARVNTAIVPGPAITGTHTSMSNRAAGGNPGAMTSPALANPSARFNPGPGTNAGPASTALANPSARVNRVSGTNAGPASPALVNPSARSNRMSGANPAPANSEHASVTNMSRPVARQGATINASSAAGRAAVNNSSTQRSTVSTGNTSRSPVYNRPPGNTGATRANTASGTTSRPSAAPASAPRTTTRASAPATPSAPRPVSTPHVTVPPIRH